MSASSHEHEKGTQDFGQRETVTPANETRPRRGGCLGFLKKWWWLLLIILIIVVLVVVLPIIFVAVPKKIRSEINKSVLDIQGIHLLNTTTDTALVAINSTVSTNSSYTAKIDAFNASLYLEDKLPHTPFLFLEMPEMTSHKVSPVNISQQVTILDQQAFADYNSWYLLNESFRVTVDGFTHVHVSGLPSTKAQFKKTVTLTGLNGFKGVNVTSSSVSLQPDSLGDNFHGFATIPNPSVLTVDIGNVTFNNFLNTTQIGEAFIDNLILFPGDNNVSLRANISQAPILIAVESQPFCNTGVLPLTFVGTNVTNNAQDIPYFDQAFRSNVLDLDINVGAALKPLNITVACAL